MNVFIKCRCYNMACVHDSIAYFLYELASTADCCFLHPRDELSSYMIKTRKKENIISLNQSLIRLKIYVIMLSTFAYRLSSTAGTKQLNAMAFQKYFVDRMFFCVSFLRLNWVDEKKWRGWSHLFHIQHELFI